MRNPDEVRMWKEDRDPIRRAHSMILEKGLADEGQLAAIHAEVERQVADWATYALDSPLPDANTALDFVYANPEVIGR
jgi:pyruvate dehydrogenase E1 component alpha subunit